jgi:Mg/Co/Ni transporter MgtE
VQATGWKVSIVVNEANVVLGRLRGDIWNAPADTLVEDVMENGPTTFRPDYTAQALADRMRGRNVENTLITRSDGFLVGMFYRADAEARLGH